VSAARDVGAATREGVVWACAMCDRYWWGRARGLPYCEATARGAACCGPWGGGTYPWYSGPLLGHLAGYCFLCGAASHAGIRVAGQPGLIGVCAGHEPLVPQYVAKARTDGRPALAHVPMPAVPS
jgi:hypothetical protein